MLTGLRRSGSRRPLRRLLPCGDDRGAVTVELAVLFVIVFSVVLSGVQAAMVWHARNIALQAARAGVDAGRVPTGTPADADRAATSFARRAGGTALSGIRVSTSQPTPTSIQVTVTGTAPRVLPLPAARFTVTQTARAERERFTVDVREFRNSGGSLSGNSPSGGG